MPATVTASARLAGSEVGLARAAAAGDERAFNQIVNRYDARLKGLCRSILRDAGEAEDAAQEAWLRAWRALPRYNGGALDAWLLTIARREAYRAASRRSHGALPMGDLPEPADTGPDPHARARGAELAEGLAAAVRDLPSGYREIAARDLSGQAPAEFAELLHLRPGTARVRAFRARKMLAERMEWLDLAA
jgi:RNA polymerase sigma-70 factor (ECF subfamily)